MQGGTQAGEGWFDGRGLQHTHIDGRGSREASLCASWQPAAGPATYGIRCGSQQQSCNPLQHPAAKGPSWRLTGGAVDGRRRHQVAGGQLQVAVVLQGAGLMGRKGSDDAWVYVVGGPLQVAVVLRGVGVSGGVVVMTGPGCGWAASCRHRTAGRANPGGW